MTPSRLAQRKRKDPFARDDYSAVQARYFSDLINEGHVDADPSGWLLTHSASEKLISFPVIRRRDFARYYLDDGRSINAQREPIRQLLSAWEGSSLQPERFTVCPSGALASFVTLCVLKWKGVKRVIFETPSYYGTIEQADELGLEVDLLPTYRRDGYELPSLTNCFADSSPVALWLTQPRASLGFDQSIKTVEGILHCAGREHFVVIDEVTDQSYPAHLGRLPVPLQETNLIRIRSFTKGMGLNGFRLSAVLHPSTLRTSFIGAVELFGGTLDAYSLLSIQDLSTNLERFKTMLSVANRQVNDLRRRAEAMTLGSACSINHLVNGYIGSMVVNLESLGRSHARRRAAFLAGCRDLRTPVILGSSFYLAKDPPSEGIRLNFFMSEDQVLRGIGNILRIVS